MFEIELDEGSLPKNTLKLPYNRTSKSILIVMEAAIKLYSRTLILYDRV